MTKTTRYILSGAIGLVALGLGALAVRSYRAELNQINNVREEAKENALRKVLLAVLEPLPIRVEDDDELIVDEAEEDTEGLEADNADDLGERLAFHEKAMNHHDNGYLDLTDPNQEPYGHDGLLDEDFEGDIYILGMGENRIEPFSADYRELVNRYYDLSLQDEDVEMYLCGKTWGIGARGGDIVALVEVEDESTGEKEELRVRRYDAKMIQKLRDKMLSKMNQAD